MLTLHKKQTLKQHTLSTSTKGLDNAYAAPKIEWGREPIKTTGIATNKTVLIGDTGHDLKVAQELGIDLILIAKDHQPFERRKKLHPNALHGLKAAA